MARLVLRSMFALAISTLARPSLFAAADSMLRRSAQDASEADLLSEVDLALGRGHGEEVRARAPQLREAMRPLFASLPRTEEGLLPPAGVRYLLHRIFVERNSWFVRGLEDDGRGWNASALAKSVLGARAAPAFDARLARGGLGLGEAAVFAATLEALVAEESAERLRTAFRFEGVEVEGGGISEQQIEQAIDAYMAIYVLDLRLENDTEQVRKEFRDRTAKYPEWTATQRWVREVRASALSVLPGARTSFATTALVMEEALKRYGLWQNRECHAMRHDLMALERGGTGRVPLQEFYGAALKGKWMFSEAKEYLRDLGALDETRPGQPSVLIANYVNAPSNCLADSKFYSVCCINECEALLRPIEVAIAAPDALPGSIVEVVEQLSSATVPAPRMLPATLVERLEEIAAQHSGRVPVHGRLFSQWMHLAFPRECPYPHLAGSTAPMRGGDWRLLRGEHFLANSTAMRLHIEEAAWGLEAAKLEGAEDPEPTWSTAEEQPLRPEGPAPRPWLAAARAAPAVVAASSVLLVLARAAVGARGALGRAQSKAECHCV